MIQKNEILAGITGMRQVAAQLMKWADDLEKNLSAWETTQPKSPEPVTPPADDPAAPAPSEPLTLPALRAFLAEKCRQGYAGQVKALIASFGAASLKDVQPIHYIPLRDAAAALGADEGGEMSGSSR